jgi:type I restriction enzyme S subunit
MTQIRKILILIPRTKTEQDEIAKRISRMNETIKVTEDQARKLRSLKTALMQDLLTGRKRVTALLEPEPQREKMYA